MRPTAIATICLTLLAAAPAAAQQTQPGSSPSDIVVEGTRDREEQVRDFVTALTPAPQGSISRMIDEVCPVASGLDPAQNEAVANRLRAVAAAAQLRVAAKGCAPNALVVVTPDKRAFIEALANRRSDFFGMLSKTQIRRLARSPGPAAAWQLEGPVDADGIPLRWSDAAGAYVNDTTTAPTRLRTTGRRGFDASVMVVAADALKGLTTTQLADYAAMRMFAKLNPARLPAPPPPTILTILEAPFGTPVPVTMTSWDLGLLRGIYASTPDLLVGSQRSEIAREVLKELDGAQAEPD